MTNEELDALQGLCDGAIPGPYRYIWQNDHLVCLGFDRGDVKRWDIVGAIKDEKTGEFIAAARTAMPALIAEVRRLQAENDVMMKGVDAFRQKIPELAFTSADWSHGAHPKVVELDDIEEAWDDAFEAHPWG